VLARRASRIAWRAEQTSSSDRGGPLGGGSTHDGAGAGVAEVELVVASVDEVVLSVVVVVVVLV
jgi:hypothetical protein